MSWMAVCAEEAIAENDLREFEVGGVTVLLTRPGNQYFAYPPLCPHQAEPLRKVACDGEQITCFKHLWQWDMRTGACTGTESNIPLKTYEVRMHNGVVQVFLDQPLTYEYQQ
jgi:toluene monooxygenase system ferredoxin subunit